jgi:hypothetical protein
MMPGNNEAFHSYMGKEETSKRPGDLWITSGGNTRKFKKLLEKHGFIPKPESHSIIDYQWSITGRSLKMTFASGDQIFLRVTRVTSVAKKVIKKAAKR